MTLAPLIWIALVSLRDTFSLYSSAYSLQDLSLKNYADLLTNPNLLTHGQASDNHCCFIHVHDTVELAILAPSNREHREPVYFDRWDIESLWRESFRHELGALDGSCHD